jgi:hypothetical protein
MCIAHTAMNIVGSLYSRPKYPILSSFLKAHAVSEMVCDAQTDLRIAGSLYAVRDNKFDILLH